MHHGADRARNKFFVPVFIVTVAAALLALIVSSLTAPTGSQAAADTVAMPSSPTSPSAQASLAAMKVDLSVYPSDLSPSQASCKSDAFLKNSLPNSKLRWSHSVSTPYTSSNPSAELTEQLAENCQNPTVLMQTVEGLSATPAEGTTIGALNSWMADFIGKKASGMGNGTSTIGFLTKKVNSGNDKFVTADYQKVAVMTNTLLLRLHNMGNKTYLSQVNYHVAVRDGLTTGKLPVATLNTSKQDNLPALVLEYTSKLGCSVLRVGFNVGDKRFERFATPTCTPPTTKPSSHPSTSTSHSTPPSGHPSHHPSTPPTHPSSPPSHHTPPPSHHTTPPPTTCTNKNVNGVCVAPKDSSKNVKHPPSGTTKQGSDPLQTSTSAGTGVSGNIDTSGKTGSNGKTGSQDSGSSALPAQGATPNPPAYTAPTATQTPVPVATQAPPSTSPGTPIGDPG